MGSFLLGM
jgi:hypothetical protein